MSKHLFTHSAADRHLLKEHEELLRTPLSGIKDLKVDQAHLRTWEFTIVPTKAPYKNFGFNAQIQFSDHFPIKPPAVLMKSKIFHPNIGKDGAIDLEIIKEENWNKRFTVNMIMKHLVDMLNEPIPHDDPIRSEVAKLFIENKSEFMKKAEEHSKKFAIKQFF